MDIISKASGVTGMINGQISDIGFEGKDRDEKVLEFIHKRKTAAMITASVLSGAAICGANQSQLSPLKEYGECIGLVFQIVDDILDVVGDENKMGKTLGKDKTTDKQSFALIYGIEKSKQIAHQKTIQAIAALKSFGDKADELKELALVLENRNN